MSDAMSNHEIEDVLSSIRRLVAQENGQAPTSRLVLTPALRVAQDSAAEKAQPLLLAEERRARPEPAQAVGSDAGSPAPHPAPQPRAQPAPDPRALELQRLQETLDKLEIAASAAPISNYTPSARSAPDTPSRPETQAAAVSSEPAPDADTAERLVLTASMPDSDAASEMPQQAQDDSVKDDWAHDDLAQDVTPQDDPVDTPPTPDLAVSYSADPAPEPYHQPDAPSNGPESDGIVETLIDEDMLRALVAQLVREELRGQLGERITLQVRKLVRAEIARALDERQYL